MSKVIVRQILPAYLNGIRYGDLQLKDLGDGLNVVCAPNASGKSTLAEAIGYLFRPQDVKLDRKGDGKVDFTITGDIEIEGDKQSRTATPKSLPFDGFDGRAKMYRLDLISLFTGLQDHRETILSILGAGGVLAVGDKPNLKSNVANAAIEARRALNTAQSVKAKLAEEEDKLPLLEKQVQESGQAVSLLAQVDCWLKRLAKSEEVARLTQELALLEQEHPGIDRQSESAVRQLENLDQLIDKGKRDLRLAREELGRVRPAGDLPTASFSSSTEDAITALIEERQNLTGQLSAARNAEQTSLQKAKADAEAVFSVLEESPENLPAPTAEDLRHLDQAAREADEIRLKIVTQEAWKQLLEKWEQETPKESTDANPEIAALVEWLKAEPVPAVDNRAGILLALACLAVPIAAIPAIGIRLVAGVLLALVAIAVAFLLRPKPATSLREDVGKRLKIDSPTHEQVMANLRELTEAHARAEAQLQAHRTIRERIKGNNMDPVAQGNWPEIASRLAIQCQDPLRLSAVATTIGRYFESRSDAEAQKATRTSVEASLAANTEALQAVLEAHGFYEPTATLEAQAKQLPRWFALAAQVARSEADLAETEDRYHQFLTEQGIPAAPDPDQRVVALRERVSLAETYSHTRAMLRDSQRALHDLKPNEDDLQAHTRRLVLEEISPSEWEVIRTDLEAAAQAHTDRIGAQKRIQLALEAAESDTDLTGKQLAYEAEMAKLEIKHQQHIAAMAKFHALTSLSERMRSENLPALVVRANDFLRRFAGGRYQIESNSVDDPAIGPLTVYDSMRSLRQTFSELSTGTRVHMIIALRLGLIEHQEKGNIRFPLVIDEATAVSDSSARRHVAQALVEIAKDRQVIVFTNQPEEVSLLQELDPTTKTHTIGHVLPEPISASSQIPDYVPPPGPRRLDLTQPIRNHDVAFLDIWERELGASEDPQLIGSALDGMDTESRGREEKLITALEEVHAYVSAKCRPLTWIEIADQKWVTGTYRGQMRGILIEVCGNPDKFLERVNRLPGIRANTKNALEEFLEGQGLINQEKPDGEELVKIALQALGTEPSARLKAQWVAAKYAHYCN